MVEQELCELIQSIRIRGCEEQTTEVKSAHQGCPEKLYDTISAFSNQNSGGTIVFGLDEKDGFTKVGVYDAQDLQKKVMEYCEQMTPIVKTLLCLYLQRSHRSILQIAPVSRPRKDGCRVPMFELEMRTNR